jgi:dihydroceramidase
MSSAPTTGFWGPPTATIDWCEVRLRAFVEICDQIAASHPVHLQRNYVSHGMIAEMWNAVSNAVIVLPCVVGLRFARTGQLERRFYLAYLALMVVGLGSFAFHATLLWPAQMADELPMLYASVVFLFCIADARWTGRASHLRAWLIAALATVAIGTTAVYLYTNDPLVHEVCYGILVAGMVFRSIALTGQSRDPRLRGLLRTAVVWYFTGFAVWNVDNLACAHLTRLRDALEQHPLLWLLAPLTQFHAWWHVGVGIGSYLFVLFASACRAETLGVPFDLQVRMGAHLLN